MIPAIITTSSLVTAIMSLNLYKLVSKNASDLSCEELICLAFNGTQADLFLDAPFTNTTPLISSKAPRFVDLGILAKDDTIGDVLERFNKRFETNADLLVVQRGLADLAVYSPLIPENRNMSLLAVLKALDVYEMGEFIRLYCGKFVKPFGGGPVEYQLPLYTEIKLQEA